MDGPAKSHWNAEMMTMNGSAGSNMRISLPAFAPRIKAAMIGTMVRAANM